jgi:hypothetical protein
MGIVVSTGVAAIVAATLTFSATEMAVATTAAAVGGFAVATAVGRGAGAARNRLRFERKQVSSDARQIPEHLLTSVFAFCQQHGDTRHAVVTPVS